MNDKELLILAAKAAGVPLAERIGLQKDYFADDRTGNEWNPLTDDGDALRLAVKLQLDCSFGANGTLSHARRIGDFEEFSSDSMAAARRSIVRAAAEVGSGL